MLNTTSHPPQLNTCIWLAGMMGEEGKGDGEGGDALIRLNG